MATSLNRRKDDHRVINMQKITYGLSIGSLLTVAAAFYTAGVKYQKFDNNQAVHTESILAISKKIDEEMVTKEVLDLKLTPLNDKLERHNKDIEELKRRYGK